MKFPIDGRGAVLLLATGLLLNVSAPGWANDVQANDVDTRAIEQPAEAEPGKPVVLTQSSKRTRTTKAARVQKPRVIARGYRRKSNDADAAPSTMPMAASEQNVLPDNVANSNAQWPAPDTSVQAVTVSPPAAPPGVPPNGVAMDQLNEADRNVAAPANGDDAASLIATKMASQVAQNSSQAAGVNVPATATPAMSAMASSEKSQVASSSDSAWGQSSLIGKMFIAFGGLLTIASAARMFVA